MATPRTLPRSARRDVVEALAESRAVALLGARQVGKSTLAEDIAGTDHPARYFTLDDPGTLRSATVDPAGFIASIAGPAVIDEIQRAPGLLLAIKRRLDSDRSRGQFLLTGSANILALPTVSDALPGRVDYINLWPFSQAELEGRTGGESVVDRLLAGSPPQVSSSILGRGAFAERAIIGGYPESRGRSPRGRSRFFSSYVASIIGRDLDDVAGVRDSSGIERLLRLVASRTGGLANYHGMGSDLGLDGNTVAAHTQILENLFLVRRLPPWHTNLGSRQIKSPKIYIVDSGLLSHLIGATGERLADGTTAGAVLESFVAMELLRLAELSTQPVSLFHYRDNQQREVDVVLEGGDGSVVGVEVKAGATPSRSDFTGLQHLRDKLGDRFKAGVVLHAGAESLPFGDRLTALPLCALWS